MKPMTIRKYSGILSGVAAVVVAIVLRWVGRISTTNETLLISSFLRTAVYMGLITFWGISIKRRIL